jgi:hypothetical protein
MEQIQWWMQGMVWGFGGGLFLGLGAQKLMDLLFDFLDRRADRGRIFR